MTAEPTTQTIAIEPTTINPEAYRRILNILTSDDRCVNHPADEVTFFVQHRDGLGMTIMNPKRSVVQEHLDGVRSFLAENVPAEQHQDFLSLAAVDLYEQEMTPETASGIIDRMVALRPLVPGMADHFDTETSNFVSIALIDGHLSVTGADTVQDIAAVICFQIEAATSVPLRKAATVQ